MPRESGASSTPRSLDSIKGLRLLDHPLARMMTAKLLNSRRLAVERELARHLRAPEIEGIGFRNRRGMRPIRSMWAGTSELKVIDIILGNNYGYFSFRI
jgi:hypothetical protein